MEDEEKKEKLFSYSKLESRSYRYLQQLAKSLELPANFKKMYLIELILAKKYKTQVEVDSIIQRVRIERLQVVSARKEWLKRKQKAVKINISSPPITATPKRFTYSPEMRTVLTYNPRRSLIRNIDENKSSSDRVLRSYDVKTLKPNYAVMNMSDVRDTVPKETRIKIITNGEFPQINLTAKCIVTKHKPSILSSSALKRPLMLTPTSDSLQSKRKRTLSGIYPILQKSIPRNIITDDVCLRQVDGSITKINALVQKRNMNIIPIQKNNYRNQEINIQDFVNSFDSGNDQNYLQIQYPNMSSLETNNAPQVPAESCNENIPDLYSVYYHKKIRAEQIRCQKIREVPDSPRLPNINDVFSQFNHINRKDYSMPLYVQVSTESERSQSYAYHVPHNKTNAITLETYFNFKNQQITNTPLLQIATTSNTKCVYSTPLISTAMAHPSTVVSEACTSESQRLDDMYEFLQFTESTLRKYSEEDTRSEDKIEPEQEKKYTNEGPSTPSSQCSQDESTCSIPEMVEDAMDIIRRDGNYMQQIETERMQCALCACVGTRGSIEGHVRRDHSSQILPAGCDRVSFRLAAAHTRWESAVLQRGTALYVLSVRCTTDCLEGTLACLTPDPEQKFGTITIYNKLTGEPFTWNGPITSLSPNLPYENEASCIKINLSKLDLFPNSANLKLINRELVSDLNTKVVVGQTLVNDIDIDVFVSIFC